MYEEHNNLLSSDNQDSKKKSRLALFVGVVLVFCGVTALLCHTFYSAQKNDILATQEERLMLTAESTMESIRLWGVSLDSQARRVSESELYRMFAQDIAQVDDQKAGMLNDPNATNILDEDIAFLAEQIPMMRTILLDFMNYNGLQDARLVSPDGNTLLSSLARPTPLQEEQANAVRKAAESNKTTYAPIRPSATGLMLDYATPLLPAMLSDEKAKPVGAFLLSVPVTGQIANFTSRGSGASHREIQSNILQFDGKQWEVIRPDSTQALPSGFELAKDTKALPFAKRIAVSGKDEVYSVGMLVPNIGWVVVEELPAHIVDTQLNRAFNLVYGAGAFLCLSVLLMLALVWWIMIGREQRSVAEKFRKLYQVIRQQKHLLDSINISLDVGLMMVDVSGKLHLVNRAFALIVGKKEEELQGQNLHNIMPDNVALQVQEAVASVSNSNESKSIEIKLVLQGEERLFRATLFPFEDKEDGSTSAAVMTIQDITEFRRSSEKRNKQQMSTIEALVSTIERVDPYLAGHSTLMRRLAELLAENMGLDAKDKDTITTAAVLSQIGRIFVPRDLLSKTDKLTPEEQAEIAKIPEYAYNILSTIDFGNPVPAAVVQMNEKLDGSGTPHHLQGDAISLHGRILGVINTFCAMASPRAFRAGLPMDVALGILRKDNQAYDQKIVENLATVLTSSQGAEAIAARLAEVTAEK